PARLRGIQVPDRLALERRRPLRRPSDDEPAVADAAPEEEGPPDAALVEELARPPRVVVGAVVEVRHEPGAGDARGRDHLFRVLGGRRQRLLAEDVLPLLHRLDAHLPVERVRRRHDDDVDVVAGHQVPPVVDGVASVLRPHLEREVPERGAEVRDRDQPQVGDRADGGGLALAHRTAADDRHVERPMPGRWHRCVLLRLGAHATPSFAPRYWPAADIGRAGGPAAAAGTARLRPVAADCRTTSRSASASAPSSEPAASPPGPSGGEPAGPPFRTACAKTRSCSENPCSSFPDHQCADRVFSATCDRFSAPRRNTRTSRPFSTEIVLWFDPTRSTCSFTKSQDARDEISRFPTAPLANRREMAQVLPPAGPADPGADSRARTPSTGPRKNRTRSRKWMPLCRSGSARPGWNQNRAWIPVGTPSSPARISWRAVR